MASRAKTQLHRAKVMNKILSVEILRPHLAATAEISSAEADADKKRNQSQAPLNPPEPIAPSLGITYPFPPQLEYAYPPPDSAIVQNIAKTLFRVPKFYTQVLHLMNKMNLPPPFGMTKFPDGDGVPPCLPPEPHSEPLPPPPFPDSQNGSHDTSAAESSDEEVSKGRKKRPRTSPPAITRLEDAGVKMEIGGAPQVPIVVMKKRPIIAVNIKSKGKEAETSQPQSEAKEVPAHQSIVDPPFCIPVEELEAGRMPADDLCQIPAFRNYVLGVPSNVLYVKNLAKDASTEDLVRVFGVLFASLKEAQDSMQIRLMKEGRMKGQAFVTFPTIELASRAVGLCHGFMLHNRPLVIQYGKKTP